MAGVLTNAMASALTSGRPLAIFAQIDHPSGTAYLCTGVGARTWNGQTWTGTGTLGGISPVKHSSEIAIQDIVFTLSGVDADTVAGLSDDVRNRSGLFWLACFDDADNVIADPYQLGDSVLDYQMFEVADDGTATISIVAHSGFYTLDRGVDEAWTPENQKLTYPIDIGLDQIPALQNADLQWTPS